MTSTRDIVFINGPANGRTHPFPLGVLPPHPFEVPVYRGIALLGLDGVMESDEGNPNGTVFHRYDLQHLEANGENFFFYWHTKTGLAKAIRSLLECYQTGSTLLAACG